jgi:dTDP-4-dehydrorhamnose 3,5-epimerase
MKTLATSLAGVILVELDAFTDGRGRFVETFQRARYLELGIGVGLEFVQDNFSSSVRGVLRGLHYQLAHPQGKLVHVTRGEVFDVAVDLRVGSPGFGRWFGTTLSAENRRQLWIPPGFAHGFVVTGDGEADFVYKVTAPYAPGDEHAIRWDDPEMAIAWPVPGGGPPILSGKDAAAPTIAAARARGVLPAWIEPGRSP